MHYGDSKRLTRSYPIIDSQAKAHTFLPELYIYRLSTHSPHTKTFAFLLKTEI